MRKPFQFIIRLERRATFHDKIDLERLHQVTGSGDRQESGQTLPFSRRRGCCQNIYFWYLRSEEQQVSGIHVVNLQRYTESDWAGTVSIKVRVQSVRLIALDANDDEVTFLIGKRSQHGANQFGLRIAGDRFLCSHLHIFNRDADVRNYLAGDANRPGFTNGHHNITAGVSALHVGDLAAHQIFTIESEGMSDLRFVVGVIAVTKIPINPQSVSIRVHRTCRKCHLVILIDGSF